MEADSDYNCEPMISVVSNQEFGAMEFVAEINFSHLEKIRGNYVFTKEVRQEMSQKQQYGMGFGIMKKTLNLAIMTGRLEEIYELHLKLTKKMEAKSNKEW